MATVTGLTAAKMLEMAGEEILTGQINSSGHLILTKRNGSTVDAGVATPPVGSQTWPVGSIYMSVSSTNPGPQLGGTWIAWGTGRVPVGVDAAQSEFNTVEEVGGAKTHTHPLSDNAVAQIVQGSGGVVASRRITPAFLTPYAETFRAAGTAGTPAASQPSGTPLRGDTDAATNLQPYITCYMWKRVA